MPHSTLPADYFSFLRLLPDYTYIAFHFLVRLIDRDRVSSICGMFLAVRVSRRKSEVWRQVVSHRNFSRTRTTHAHAALPPRNRSGSRAPTCSPPRWAAPVFLVHAWYLTGKIRTICSTHSASHMARRAKPRLSPRLFLRVISCGTCSLRGRRTRRSARRAARRAWCNNLQLSLYHPSLLSACCTPRRCRILCHLRQMQTTMRSWRRCKRSICRRRSMRWWSR